MIHETPAACFNCCDRGGGTYKAFEGETEWHMGLDASGQAHYACKECSVLLFDVRPIDTGNVVRCEKK